MEKPRIRLKGDNHVLQRLQIGSVGVIAVLLMVAMASLILGGTTNEEPIDPLAAQDRLKKAAEAPKVEKPTEPLVDLGVVPDIAPEESLADPDEVMSKDEVPDLPDTPANRTRPSRPNQR